MGPAHPVGGVSNARSLCRRPPRPRRDALCRTGAAPLGADGQLPQVAVGDARRRATSPRHPSQTASASSHSGTASHDSKSPLSAAEKLPQLRDRGKSGEPPQCEASQRNRHRQDSRIDPQMGVDEPGASGRARRIDRRASEGGRGSTAGAQIHSSDSRAAHAAMSASGPYMPPRDPMPTVPSCSPSRRREGINSSMRRVCATASEWRCSPGPASSGARSTSATASATISCPIL
jgi:hypothetical protein